MIHVVLPPMIRPVTQFQYLQAAAERNDHHWYLWTLTNILRLVFSMANEAGLESVLSAAYALKHETDMKKSFPSREEAFDKAKEMGLTPDQAARQITTTPSGQFALDDVKRGEVVKSDRWRPARFPISHHGCPDRTGQITSVICVGRSPESDNG